MSGGKHEINYIEIYVEEGGVISAVTQVDNELYSRKAALFPGDHQFVRLAEGFVESLTWNGA